MTRKTTPQRLGFFEWFDKISWALMTGVAIYAAAQLDKLGQSVSQLNTNVAVLVTQVSSQEKVQGNFDAKLAELDKRYAMVADIPGRLTGIETRLQSVERVSYPVQFKSLNPGAR